MNEQLSSLPIGIQKSLDDLRRISDGIYLPPYTAALIRGIIHDLVREMLDYEQDRRDSKEQAFKIRTMQQ